VTITAEKTDTDLKMDVLAELKFEPSVNITDIGVLVKDGVVTLNGHASSHGEKMNAVRVTKRVAGVLAIADDIEVNLPVFGQHTDSDIAASAATRLNWSTEIPAGTVEVTVRDGRITLEGVVEWGYQKHAAENAIQNLAGVKGISNLITINPTETASEIGTDITSAIKRNALLDDTDIHVETSGSSVMLSGKVHNHAEWEEAVRIAWAAPGVHTVDNQLKVDWFWGLAD
jgi:osmotically-inducible protein OsmY